MKIQRLRFVVVVIILTTIPLLYFSCYWHEPEPIKKGLKTILNGNVHDATANQPLNRAKVTVHEMGYSIDSLGGYYRIKDVVETYSDEKGDFEIQFTTSGRGYRYDMSIVPENGRYDLFFLGDYVVKAGQAITENFVTCRVSKVATTIHLAEHTAPAVQCYVSWPSKYFEIGKDVSDTTVDLYIIQDTKNVLRMYYADLDSPQFFNERIDTINLIGNFGDEVTREIFVSPDDFPRRK